MRKLRLMLEAAVPERQFIDTHFGFGYRLAAERSQLNGHPLGHEGASIKENAA